MRNIFIEDFTSYVINNSWAGNYFNLSSNNLWSKNTFQCVVVRPHQSHTAQQGPRQNPCRRLGPAQVVPSSLLSSHDHHMMRRPSSYGIALCSTQQRTYSRTCTHTYIMFGSTCVHSLCKSQVILLCSAAIPHGSCCEMVRSVDNDKHIYIKCHISSSFNPGVLLFLVKLKSSTI